MPLSLASHPLIRKLGSIFDLSEEEKDAIVALPFQLRDLRADQDIIRDRDQPSQCCLVMDGFAYRYAALSNGRRQIFSFHLPGDMPDLHGLHLETMDHSLATMSASKIAFLPHSILRDFLRRQPRITDAMWRDTLIDAAIFRQWMANLGRRGAFERIAHLLCELYVRMRAIGRAGPASYSIPVTQEEIGGALGLSSVHVNRTMQELRAAGLISTPRHTIVIDDWPGLQEAGEFDAAYLHIRRAA